MITAHGTQMVCTVCSMAIAIGRSEPYLVWLGLGARLSHGIIGSLIIEHSRIRLTIFVSLIFHCSTAAYLTHS